MRRTAGSASEILSEALCRFEKAKASAIREARPMAADLCTGENASL